MHIFGLTVASDIPSLLWKKLAKNILFLLYKGIENPSNIR